MNIELVMPKAGLTMVEGTIGEWKCKEGDFVHKGDIILDIENEKNSIAFECTADGYLHIAAKTGDVVPVGNCIAYVTASKDDFKKLGNIENEKEAKTYTEEQKPECVKMETMQPSCGHIKASGLARNMAKSLGINLLLIKGTGPNNRITARDINNYINQNQSFIEKKRQTAIKTEKGYTKEVITKIPLSGIRKTILKNMRTSVSEMAQSTAITEIDMTDLITFREKLASKQEMLGQSITINDLLAMATIKMLKRHPLVNATFDGIEISSYSYVNLAIAVASDKGLMVPVLEHADEMSLVEISKNLKDLIIRARNGGLKSDEQTGGTFTISNVGIYTIDMSTPIINSPQVALLGFGRPVKKPSVYNDAICIRTIAHLMLTFDHRVFDGTETGSVIKDMKELIENPELILA